MPKPTLQAMVLADHVYRDASTGKFIIAGTFSALFQGQQKPLPQDSTRSSEIAGPRQTFANPPGKAGSPYLYLALTGVHGRVSLGLRYINLADSSVLIEGQIDITSADPVAITEHSFPLPMLPISPGQFSLDILYEGEILGSWRVTVKQQTTSDDTRR
jgi:hypothetical protein